MTNLNPNLALHLEQSPRSDIDPILLRCALGGQGLREVLEIMSNDMRFTRADVENLVNRAAKSVFFKQPTPSTKFEDWNVDSYDLAQLALLLQQELTVRFSDSAVYGWKSFADLYDHVEKVARHAKMMVATGAAPPSTSPEVVDTSSASDYAFEGSSIQQKKEGFAFLFPGQGAQKLGMGNSIVDIPAARSLFDRASAILGYDLLQLCLEGPEDKLNTTAICQPAILVASLAAIEKLRIEKPEQIAKATIAAGLSLGEYTALVFADAISFEDAVRVVAARGRAMQAASEATPSTMVSVMGLNEEKVKVILEKASALGKVSLANFLCPGNIVVAGDIAACEAVEKIAMESGATKVSRLAVAGAFHTSFMAAVVKELEQALQSVTIKTPRIPVLSNVDGFEHKSPEEIKQKLLRQTVEPVRWQQCMENLIADNVLKMLEVGPGAVLTGLMRHVNRVSTKKADVASFQV